jgi:hypothetical protein
MNAQAVGVDRVAISGASTLPALSSAVVEELRAEMSSLESIEVRVLKFLAWATILLARRLAGGEVFQSGAFPCMGFLLGPDDDRRQAFFTYKKSMG